MFVTVLGELVGEVIGGADLGAVGVSVFPHRSHTAHLAGDLRWIHEERAGWAMETDPEGLSRRQHKDMYTRTA